MQASVLAVTGKHTHFGTYSGYNRLYHYLNQYMPVSIHQNRLKPWELKLARKFALKHFRSSTYGLYHNTAHLLTEYEAARSTKKLQPAYLHVAFLEDTLGYLAETKKALPCKLFATSHQPQEWWQMTHKYTASLKGLDGMIVLSKKAQVFFDQYLPRRVKYIPHGVDTTFFNYQLRAKTNSPKRILFVGSWLRDFETFVQTIEVLEQGAKGQFCYDIVYPGIPEIPANPLHRLLRFSHVNWFRNISDSELKELYHHAAVLFIPFINATGNNALLEAAACGTPILTNRLESIVDCFGGDHHLYAVENGDVATYLRCIQHITDEANYEEVAQKTMRLRRYTEQYLDWSIIAKAHQTFFESAA